MARRVAINLGQRSSTNGTRGRGRFSKRSGQTDSSTNSVSKDEHALAHKDIDFNCGATNTAKIDSDTACTKAEMGTSSEFDSPLSEISDTSRGRKRTMSDIQKEDMEGLLVDVKGIMGFDNFATTKNKHVKGTECYGIKFKQVTEYRQYMNREGGFNRELSPTRTERKKIKMNLKTKLPTTK